MATGNPLLGQLRGSIGDVTFSRLNGQQVSRSRNRSPRNPQSDSQMYQRVFLKTVSMAYSVLRENLGDQSFQRNAIGSANQRAFLSKNIRLLASAVEAGLDSDYNFASRDQAQAPLNPYLISSGSLPNPAAVYRVASENNTQIALTRAAGLSADSTYADVCEALGLPAGSQLTIIIVNGTRGNIDEVLLNRIILAPASGDMSTAFIENGLPNMANPSNITDRLRGITFSEAGEILLNLAGRDVPAGVAVVASQKSGNTWLYSETQLVLNQPSGYQSLADAVNSWFAAEALAPAREYTRQAEQAANTVLSESGEVTSMLLRVYQFNELDGWGNSARRLVKSVEVNSDQGTITTVADDYTTNDNFNAIAVEVQYFGTMPRTYNETNLSFGGGIIDQSTFVEPLKYTAGTKSYRFVAKVGYFEAQGSLNQNIVLNDNNGNGVALVELSLAGIPEQPARLTGGTIASSGNFFSLTLDGSSLGVPVGVHTGQDGAWLFRVTQSDENTAIGTLEGLSSSGSGVGDTITAGNVVINLTTGSSGSSEVTSTEGNTANVYISYAI